MNNGKKFYQLPVWMLIAIDIVVLGLALIVFALFDHAMPRKLKTEVSQETLALIQKQQNQTQPTQQPNQLQITSQQDQTQPTQIEPSAAPAVESLATKFSDKFTDGEPYWNGDNYVGRNLNVRYAVGNVADSVYYLQDIYIRDINCLLTAFGEDTYGKGYAEDMVEIAPRKNAIGAINGDYYSTGSLNVIIRNGEIYRDAVDPFESVCVLYKDGTMEVYNNGEFTVAQLIERGAWNTWSFGPGLLDENGQAIAEFSNPNNRGRHPRTVVGMVEPGHYMFITVDGRQTGYSEGLDYPALSRLCSELGLKVAYNLDGGATAQMYFRDQRVNRPSDERSLSDIIYVTDIY